MVEGPLSFAVFIGQERTVTGMVMGLLKDPDADDDLSASDTLTATLSGGGSMDPFDTLVANVPDTLPIPPGYSSAGCRSAARRSSRRTVRSARSFRANGRA